MEEIPIIISDQNSKLFGILRTSASCKKLVILLPAATGTRIGPQRIYVQIGRALVEENIASLTIDLPPNGDSYDVELKVFQGTYKEKLTQHYKNYLDKITGYLNSNYSFEEYILLSISVGCIPVLYYSKLNNFSRVILLSPNHLSDEVPKINKKNLKVYLQKVFKMSTWQKIFTLNLNLKKIKSNVFASSQKKEKGKSKQGTDYLLNEAKLTSQVNILNIFGEKDHALQKNQLFWQNYVQKHKYSFYTEKLVSGADHSFFGWSFKIEVCNLIVKWLNQENEYFQDEKIKY